MRFAKIVFWIAAVWGVLILTPLYFMLDIMGRNHPPPITHPEFFYSFVGVALAWQLAFFVIARDPLRHRPLIIPSIVEKLIYVTTTLVIVMQGRLHSSALIPAATDGLLDVLFVIAYFKTAGATP